VGEHISFVGLDVHKATIAVCVAEAGWDGEVRFVGEIPNDAAALDRLAARLGRGGRVLRFVLWSKALPSTARAATGSNGTSAIAVMTVSSGDRIKTDRRDATTLARLHRAGELAPVWMPDPEHKAMRDLVRARADMVEALQAMRGVSLIVASALVAEVGDMRRFDNPRQLMTYLGLVPSEHSSGAKRRQGAITKAGSPLARRMLVEGAWPYRLPARVSAQMKPRLTGLPRDVRETAWKGQVRLCAWYRRLQAAGKRPQVVVTAIARKMVGFAWAIGRMAAPPTVAARGICQRDSRGEVVKQTRRSGEAVERSGEPSADTTGRLRTDPRH
jgi:hypothetical protein